MQPAIQLLYPLTPPHRIQLHIKDLAPLITQLYHITPWIKRSSNSYALLQIVCHGKAGPEKYRGRLIRCLHQQFLLILFGALVFSVLAQSTTTNLPTLARSPWGF